MTSEEKRSRNEFQVDNQLNNSDISFRKLMPLPHEIQQMSEDETGCQYCGISYLLLSKYEKMETLFGKLQLEQESLKQYIKERPEILSRLNGLEQKNIKLEHTVNELKNIIDAKETDINVLKDKLEEDVQEHLNVIISKQKAYDANKNEKLNRLEELLKRSKSEIAQTKMYQIKGLEQLQISLQEDLKGFASQLEQKYQMKFAEIETATLGQFHSKLTKKMDEVDVLKQKLEESQSMYETLKTDYQSLKSEYKNHASFQKQYTGEMQENCLKLEEELQKANRELMQLATHRNKIEKNLAEFQKKCKLLEDREHNLSHEWEKKILLIQRDNELEKNDSEGLSDLKLALSKRDEKIYLLEKTTKNLESQIQEANTNQLKTVEAHQSRIQQLQEKFMEDLRRGSADDVYKKEQELNKIHQKELKAALETLRNDLDMKSKDECQKLRLEISRLKSSNEESLSVVEQTMSNKWQQREQDIQEYLNNFKNQYESEKNRYNKTIDSLKSQLEELENKSKYATMNVSTTHLQSLLAKKDAEIIFLKDTVRVECEERMGLVGTVAKLQKLLSQRDSAIDLNSSTQIENSGQNNSTPNGRETPKTPLSSKDAEFFKLFQNASNRNERKIAKQTRNGYARK
ncbi:hypothetical protein BC833DRAFT_567351 [Globomyces pollinis-pini]|nr:hypothetical protein BC833DRAFT_567351 [Globomyces pollinis-pini]